jgi:hypothetical protein
MQTMIAAILLVLSVTISGAAASEYLEEFKANYDSLQRQVLDRSGEVVAIDSFTYVKDVATFRFGRGTMLLQRPVHGRPTVAVFVGKGHAHIEIPVEIERNAYLAVAQDSVVDDSFTVCFMRIADDFDLKVKERFTFQPGQMSIVDFGKVRDYQGEYYFKPTMFDWYDNLIQLLISVYERRSDGYFWARFSKNIYRFDPNRSEQVALSYLRELNFTEAPIVTFQRAEARRYDVDSLSNFAYLLSQSNVSGELELGGADGWIIDRGFMDVMLQVERDSLRFCSLFLDKHYQPDSVTCNGQRVDFILRRDFYHLLLLLPEYVHQGDSLRIGIWYHNAGRNWAFIVPWVENGRLFQRTLKITFPRQYDYLAACRGPVVSVDKQHSQCTAGPVRARDLFFLPLATGWDTVSRAVDEKLSVKFVAYPSKSAIPPAEYQREVIEAAQFYIKRFGYPSKLAEINVMPYANSSAFGVEGLPMTRGIPENGGYSYLVGRAIASQWFGATVERPSYREMWIADAVPEYMALLYVQQKAGSNAMYTTLNINRKMIQAYADEHRDVPLGVGGRAASQPSLARGIWLLHMLRVLMFDPGTMSDQKFIDFLADLISTANAQPVSNVEFQEMAEKHLGTRLGWFFSQWLYDRRVPRFDESHTVEEDQGQFYLKLNVKTSGVSDQSIFPVTICITMGDRKMLLRQMITARQNEYVIGPLSRRPDKVIFNEYSSVLCSGDIRDR